MRDILADWDAIFLISAVDEQNAQTSKDLAQSLVTAATTAVSDAQEIPNIVAEDNRYERQKSLSGKKYVWLFTLIL